VTFAPCRQESPKGDLIHHKTTIASLHHFVYAVATKGTWQSGQADKQDD